MAKNMKEVGRSEWGKMQMEKERERRRLRDRLRRQSMSTEEREKHLARRRRNYQLRRLRSGAARLEPQSEQTTCKIQPKVLDEAVLNVESRQMEGNLNAECRMYESLEIPGNKLAKFSGQLRLNHLKHLARSLNGSASTQNGNVLAAHVMKKGNEAPGDHYVDITPKVLRLNHIKCLARSLNSVVKETSCQNQTSST